MDLGLLLNLKYLDRRIENYLFVFRNPFSCMEPNDILLLNRVWTVQEDVILRQGDKGKR